MANDKIDILFPVGRMVGGDLYEMSDTDADGNPRVIKTGPKAGQPAPQCYFALAIPKEPGHTHWAQTEWGKKIWDLGHAAWPQGQASAPTFAWKIVDGDSTIPNKKGTAPASRIGWTGNWVINFNGGFLPPIYNANGSQRIEEEGAVKRGYFIQVFGNVASNGSLQSPGVYVNYSMVALAGYGEEIHYGPDPTAVGFGGALPPGASAVPVGGFAPPVPAPIAAVAPPVAPTPAPAPVARTAVAPAPGFLTPPPQALAAPPAPAPTPPPAHTMTKAAVASYEAYRSSGWTDEQLRAAGLMV